MSQPLTSAASQPAAPANVHPRWPARFAMLDAWRGLAALAVVCHHAFDWAFGAKGVMLFFVISGYCITAAAESARAKSLGFRGFMARRIKRIYPPYLLAIGYFVLTRIPKVGAAGLAQAWHFFLHNGGSTPPNQLARTPLEWLQNGTLTQWFTLLRHPLEEPQNNPTNFLPVFWSLQYEEQFYLLVALILPLTLLLRGSLTLALAAISIAWIFHYPGDHRGIFIEYWFYFALGAVIFYRHCHMPHPWQRRTTDLALIANAAICISLWFFSPTAPAPLLRTYDHLATVSLFALALVALRPLDSFMSHPLLRPLAWLGLISYSLYLIHQCNINLASIIAGKLFAPDSLLNGVLQITIHLAIATVFWFLCERPFLNKPLRSTTPETSPAPIDPDSPQIPSPNPQP